jgi:hypothetical protein
MRLEKAFAEKISLLIKFILFTGLMLFMRFILKCSADLPLVLQGPWSGLPGLSRSAIFAALHLFSPHYCKYSFHVP